MAIIIDKEQKKRDIALACKDLFVKNIISTVTISQIAKTAGIGKGTVYEYFKNKEEIVFELVTFLMQEHNRTKEDKISRAGSTREKIKIFYEFYYSEESSDLRALYKDFVSISLAAPREELLDFQTKCFEYYFGWTEKLISEGVDNGEIREEGIKLAKGLFVIGDGMFIASLATNVMPDLEQEINSYIDTIFNLIEIKEKK